MRTRRIAPDEGARAPFAVLAVIIFLLSSFSVAFIGATTRQEMLDRLARSELHESEEIVAQLQNEIDTDVRFVALETFRRYLDSMNSDTLAVEMLDLSMINETFQHLVGDLLSKRFPAEMDGHLVEEEGHNLDLLPRLERAVDLVPKRMDASKGRGTYELNDFNRIYTVQTWDYGVSSTLYDCHVIGYLNISITDLDSDLKQGRTLWIEREIEVPLPFVLGKMESLQSTTVGSSSEIARLTKYILTTIAQFKAFQGVGMGMNGLPDDVIPQMHAKKGDATDVLTLEDVELAVNLALLLESVKTFRTWDPAIPEAIHDRTLHLAQNSLQFEPVEKLSTLLENYSSERSLDAGDIVGLYLGLGGSEGRMLNLEAIISQAMYGVLDQFLLKYLDYVGVMPYVDEVWKGVQVVDGILQEAGEAIEDIWNWFVGNGGGSWHDVLQDWLEKRLVHDAGLEIDNFLSLLVEDRRGSAFDSFDSHVIDSYPSIDLDEGGFDVRFVVRLTDEFHTWFSNGTAEAHRFKLSDDDVVVGHDHVRFSLEASFHSQEHEIDFDEVNAVASMDSSSIWRHFYDTYFAKEDEGSSVPQTIREGLRGLVQEIAKDALGRVRSFVDGRQSLSSIDPSDDTSFLSSLKDAISSSVNEVFEFYKGDDGKEEMKKIAASYTNWDAGLLEDLKYFLVDQYDGLVGYPSVIDSVTDSVAMDLLKNHTTIGILDEEIVENSNIPHDWTYAGNLTQDLLSAEEVGDVLLNGGVESDEQFTHLKQALIDDIGAAYQEVKMREMGIGLTPDERGVLVQVIDAAEESCLDTLSAILGGGMDVMDGVGFLDMALELVEAFLNGMMDGSDASNVRYLIPLKLGSPFEFWEGDYDGASVGGKVDTVGLDVHQEQDYIDAKWSNIDPDTLPPIGTILVDFNPKAWEDGDDGYDPSDIKGKHYTDVTSFSQRPFESRWYISILGRVPISVATQEQVFLGSSGSQPVRLNSSIEINFTTTIVVYTGWELGGVGYNLTNTFLADITGFLDTVWDVIVDPVMVVADYFQMASDFLREVFRTLLEYRTQALEVMAEATDLAINLLQSFLSEVLSVASDCLADYLRQLSVEHFFIEFAGLTFEVKLISGEEREDCQCKMWVRARGDILGLDMDFITYLIELEEPIDDVKEYITVEGNVKFGHRGTANVTIDPLMLLHPYMVEIHASELDDEGSGWAFDLFSPETDIYRTTSTSLSEAVGFVPSIPIPVLGVEVGVDFGISVKHVAVHPKIPGMNLKLVLWGMMKESIYGAWQEMEMPPTVESVERFFRSAVQGFFDRVIGKLEDTLIEVLLSMDLSVSALGSGGVASGGFRLGLVVNSTVFLEALNWVSDAIGTLLDNLQNPLSWPTFPSLPDDVLEYVGIRFELYFGVGPPKMLEKISSSSGGLPKRSQVVICVQPNMPAVGVLAGADWGDWSIDFGVYLEDFPMSSLARVHASSPGSVVDLYVLKGQIYEVSS